MSDSDDDGEYRAPVNRSGEAGEDGMVDKAFQRRVEDFACGHCNSAETEDGAGYVVVAPSLEAVLVRGVMEEHACCDTQQASTSSTPLGWAASFWLLTLAVFLR
jgi:hypothetical protein